MSELTGYTVRSMRPGDSDAVRTFLTSLSPRSLRGRFFTPWVTDAVLDRLTTVHPDELVLLAFDDATGELAAGARATRHDDDRSVADVAVTVGDRYQRRGLGRALFAALQDRAAAAGIDRVTGHVLTDNAPARRLVAGAGGAFTFDEPGVLSFQLPLRPTGVPQAA